MSVAEITYQPSFSAEVLSGAQFLPSPTQSQALVSIVFPAFGAQIAGEIIDLRHRNGYREVTIESFVDPGLSTLLTLRNERTNDANDSLQIREASLSLQVTDHTPRAHFIASALYAMLGLAGPVSVSIPDMSVDLGLSFLIGTSEISKLLQLRQTYFGLMVIEKATGLRFKIPEHISGEEMNSISFAYHAILMQQFVWRVNEITYQMPATKEMLSWLDNLKSIEPNAEVYRLESDAAPTTRTIFGKEFSLGVQKIFLNDAVIENRDAVRHELAKNDGHIVPVRIVPRSRKGQYVFTNTPRLPDVPWDEKVQSFIKLEEMLNERLAARYHELAASTLSGLTPEELEVVITPPELDEDAFLM